MNLSQLATNLDLAEEEFLELVELFLESATYDLAKLESALSAGATQETVEAAHSIKGAAGGLGFKDTHELAKRIEINARQDILEGGLEAAGLIKERLETIDQALKKQETSWLSHRREA